MCKLQLLLLSSLLHFLLFAASFLLPAPPPSSPKIIEVVFIDNQISGNSQQKPIVRQTNTKTNTDERKPATALSREFVRVKEETRAISSGISANRNPAGRGPSASNSPTQKPNSFALVDKEEGATSLQKQVRQDLQQRQTSLSLPTGYSTVSERLPSSIAVGTMTLLNTDAYQFYSFFMRIEELVRYRWETGVYKSLAPFPRQNPYTSEFTTVLETWLYPSGKVHSVRVFKKSGFAGFDNAAIQAFMSAKVMPNPPRELISENGFIRLRYSFLVRTPQKLMAQP